MKYLGKYICFKYLGKYISSYKTGNYYFIITRLLHYSKPFFFISTTNKEFTEDIVNRLKNKVGFRDLGEANMVVLGPESSANSS